MAYTRVPIALDKPLETGDYETTLSISGNQRSLTKSDLQTVLASRFGNRVQVLDWSSSGTTYTLQFRVLPASTSNTQTAQGDIVTAAFWVPVVVTVLAIAGVIYAAYRLTVEVESAVQLIPAPARGAAVAGAGVGLAGLGVGAALFGLWLLGRR